MEATRWEHIKTICLAALDAQGDERLSIVNQACGEDRGLYSDVLDLLKEFDDEPDFLETPLVRVSEFASLDDIEHSLGSTTIGGYRLVRTIGRGGMGQVYLAVQADEDFRRPVAIKIIRHGLDTEDVLQRFRLERQILASLHHPHIAQLIDGGATEDGSPYFVMEHVEGLPIDAYSDQHRLSIRERLDLLQKVCAAVQHAHQNLVVHRDLKPSNILVTPEGAPKLLDFGIGKVLGPATWLGSQAATQTDMRILTPEYASPEQVRGGSVTMATDVYGLGILMYELLTGHHPYVYGKETLQDLESAVCEETPNRPSDIVSRAETRPRRGTAENITPEEVSGQRATDPTRLRRGLAGDLDNIVLKALRKEPERRYASAAALAEDIQRHLDGLPVRARPDTFSYRAGKFVRRNVWSVSAASIALLALVAATGVTFVQSGRVALERDRAVEERGKLLEVRGFLMEMFGGTGPDVAGDSVTARQLLDLQAAAIDSGYRDQPALRAEMMEVLADGYDRLGLFADAEPMARRALDLRRATLPADHPDIASTLNLYGWIQHQRSNPQAADTLLRQAVAIRRKAGDEYIVDLARSLNDLGVVTEALGHFDEARTLYQEALDIRLLHLGEGHRAVGITANNLATVAFRQGRYEDAVRIQEQAVRTLRLAVGEDHDRSLIAQSNLAAFRMRAGDTEGAQAEFQDLLERQIRVQGREHPNTLVAMGWVGRMLTENGKPVEAEVVFADVVALTEEVYGPSHILVSGNLSGLARAVAAQGRFDDALAYEARGLAIERDVYGDDHPSVGASLASTADYLVQAGRIEEAEQHYRDALNILDRTLGAEHSRTANVRMLFGTLLLTKGRAEEASLQLFTAHAAALEGSDAGFVHESRLNLAASLLALGDHSTVDSLLAITQAAAGSSELGEVARAQLQALQNELAAATNPNP